MSNNQTLRMTRSDPSGPKSSPQLAVLLSLALCHEVPHDDYLQTPTVKRWPITL